MSKIRVAVLMGGKSGEHEVSLVSAASVMDAMDKSKYDIIPIKISKDGIWERDGKFFNPWELQAIADFVLPIMHGPNGEDGTVQGLLELLNIPYGGSGVVGCACTMDKIIAKEVFASAGLRQTPYVAFTKSEIDDKLLKRIDRELKYPIFVKPANMGSSVGITKVEDFGGLKAAIELAAHYDDRFVAEQGVNCRELEVAVLGNDDLVIGAIGEIAAKDGFYDYDEKYSESSTSGLICPAVLTKEQEDEIRAMAAVAYKAAACCGFSRVDMMMDKDSGEIYINEINSIPGFTKISMYPRLMIQAGYTYPEIIDRIIELGYERYNAKNNR